MGAVVFFLLTQDTLGPLLKAFLAGTSTPAGLLVRPESGRDGSPNNCCLSATPFRNAAFLYNKDISGLLSSRTDWLSLKEGRVASS